MWFSLFTTLLVLAVTFYQGLQGLFTALINCVLTVMAAALAFGLYEDVYVSFLIQHQPDHGRAIAFVGIFVIASLLLRGIVDQVITGNLDFPIYVDRAGGGAFGLVTAMIVIGMLSIGFQMLPFGPTFLGFSRYGLVHASSDKPVVIPTEDNRKTSVSRFSDDKEPDLIWRDYVDWQKVKSTRHNLWLNPDGFTVGLMSYLSGNALANGSKDRLPFGDLYPDFLDNLHYMRDGIYRESLAIIDPDTTLTITGRRDLRDTDPIYTYEYAGGDTRRPTIQVVQLKETGPPDIRRIVLTVKIKETNERATDKKNVHFTPGQVLLFGRQGINGPVRAYILAGVSDSEMRHRIVKLAPAQDIQREKAEGEDSIELDLMFEVPEEFVPWYLRYKLNARKAIPAMPDEKDNQAVSTPPDHTGTSDDTTRPTPRPEPDDTTPPPPPPPDRPKTGADRRDPGGRVHVFNISDKAPLFSDKLPFTLTHYSPGGDLEVTNDAVVGAKHLVAKLDENWEPTESGTRGQPIERFDVPDNMRVLQLDVEACQPMSMLGKALDFARRNVRDFYVVDRAGNQYRPVGVYAMAEVGGERIFELIYLNELERDMARIPDFQKIHHRDLKGQYGYVWLFHLPPGTEPTEFHTPKILHLDRFNLVAPD